ncbi:nicotinate phosphoribosyltransferase family-domain-containing protein [Jimgerdemannia flammicorona]|uniref:Nicotinamide phosphoribosyltransferase n=1 Tax=Jimgerdemannia flammicorona TaxID=994334 RepID=A0A433D8T6_9FUNG|nr:nicotinate phosphoribosyltransferase family-domain-containing protein [Jimgerdemannia flammicorona]
MPDKHGIPLFLLTDSYKATHAFLYPDAEKMVAYGEFRTGYDGDKVDTRLVFYGIRYILENYVAKQWSIEDVELADQFFATHNAGFEPFPYPKDLFLKFIEENNGYFPVKIEALPEGTACHIHTPVYQITAEGEYSGLVTFLETLLTMTWYPSTVATKSRRARDVIEAAYDDTVDEDGYWTLESTTVEQSIVGGTAHLVRILPSVPRDLFFLFTDLNFTGTDTMSAAFYAQFTLNNGKPVASSIPATEHSVMTSWKTEREAIKRMIDRFGIGVFACVMDSYDYVNALEKVLPSIYTEKIEKGGIMIMRPDSGDQVETVLMALRAGERVFGADVNKKGYKIIRGAGVIQGDGVNLTSLAAILAAVKEAGYSAQSVAFGMGGGLLQKLNRDTMSFATKLSNIVYKDGTIRHVNGIYFANTFFIIDLMKTPKTDGAKFSLPGEFAVRLNHDGIPIVHPKSGSADESDPTNLLRLVYDNGKPIPGAHWDDFDVVRARVKETWSRLPKTYDNLSPELHKKVKFVLEEQRRIFDLQLNV